jgi:tetratricopeptide (TPR) repeat protein
MEGATMNENPLKSQVQQLLQQVHQELCTFWDELPADERARVGQPDHWAAKDLLAHLVGWNIRTNRRMAGLPADDSPNAPTELDAINAALFEARRARSWEDLLDEDCHAFDEMIRMLEALSEEDLLQPGRLAWAGSRPAWMAMLLNAHWHPYHHLCMYLVQRGEVDRATQIQEATTQDVIDLDRGDRHKGTSLYNLACFYAQTHRPAKAIGVLTRALALAPDLIEWSKQDGDLDSLRDLDAFKAILA